MLYLNEAGRQGGVMDTRPFLILFFISVGSIVIGAVIGNVLESTGTLSKENLGPKGTAAVMVFFFGMFCLLGFSVVPLFVKAFIAMQIRIGNGERVLIRWAGENMRTIVYAFWAVYGAGLLIVLLLARDEIMKQLK
jgi:hypothetical protein